MSAITLTIHDRIARLVFDLPGEKVNKLSAAVMAELRSHLEDLHRRASEADVLVITSAKPDVFIAGADITELAAIATLDIAVDKAREGQEVFQRLADLPMPSLAVIDGACLGGGMELALACTQRVVSDAPKVRLGLPEVTLGIIPGWGGTQRLPLLIGLPAAVDLIASGRMIDGKAAKKMGLADYFISRSFLGDEVPAIVARLAAKPPKPRTLPALQAMLLHHPFRTLVCAQAQKEVLKKTKGLMPAPLAAIEVLNLTGGDFANGLMIEAQAFAHLAPTVTCHNLIDAFFASEEVKKPTVPAAPPKQVGVLGAGIMGGGIAWAVAGAGIPVRLRDLTWDAVAKGLKTAGQYDQELVKRRKLTPQEASLRAHRISGTLDTGPQSGFMACDLVIEAVVEDLGIKRKVLAQVESAVRPDTVLASNTSSLSIAAMAEGLQRPGRLVGLHFFNPVNRMPLVEVVAGPRSDPDAVARAAACARALGKTVVQVRDCPGFLVNRILLPYLNEAARILEEGGDVTAIDGVITRFGMPMGPFTLADEVGLDVGYKVSRILFQGYGERHAVAESIRMVYEDLHLTGTKGGAGFFLHQGKHTAPNPAIRGALARLNRPHHLITVEEIEERCLLTMVNEAARCIEEDIVASPAQLDLAMLMGTGFPPSKGGPLHYADALGLPAVVDRLDRLAQRHGSRFIPAPILRDLAARHQSFIHH